MSIYNQVAGTPYKREYLGTGDQAIHSTVNKVSDIIKQSYVNPYVRRFAEKIIENVPVNDKLEEVRAIHRFVSQKVRYTKDPYGMEYLQTPPTLLKMIEQGEKPAGDCDDMTMLSLSLLRSVGFPVAVKVTSYSSDGRFAHIYGLAFVNGRWLPVECVRGDYPLGWEAPNPTRTIESEVR